MLRREPPARYFEDDDMGFLEELVVKNLELPRLKIAGKWQIIGHRDDSLEDAIVSHFMPFSLYLP